MNNNIKNRPVKTGRYSSVHLYYVLLAVVLIALLQPKGGTWAYLLNVRWLYIFLISFGITNLLTPLSIKLGHKFKLLDYPEERKVHKHPVPRIGGLAIYIALVITISRNLQFSKELTGLMIGCTLIFLVSFIDDIRKLSTTVRMIVQIIAALIAVKMGVVITFIPHGWPLETLIEAVITIVWFIGITNAVNFLDGIDGLVTSFGIFCSLIFFLIAWPTEQKFLAYMNISLIGSCAGFLPYNWSKAKIFLGDSGSTLIGFLLAGMAVMGGWAENNSLVALSTPLLILAVPIFDMTYITISRIKNGHVKTLKQWLDYVGKDHLHHRLIKIGLSVPWTVGFIILVNLCFGLASLTIRESGSKGSIILLIQSLSILSIVVVLMIVGREPTDD